MHLVLRFPRGTQQCTEREAKARNDAAAAAGVLSSIRLQQRFEDDSRSNSSERNAFEKASRFFATDAADFRHIGMHERNTALNSNAYTIRCRIWKKTFALWMYTEFLYARCEHALSFLMNKDF